jgi:hypothetical protein
MIQKHSGMEMQKLNGKLYFEYIYNAIFSPSLDNLLQGDVL